MPPAGFADVEFTMGYCPTCARDVLTHPDDGADEERLLCVHCDTGIVGDARLAKGSELEADGYGEIQPAAGCGVGGCGSGGACRRA